MLKKSHCDPTGSYFTSSATLATSENNANLSNTSLHDAMKVTNTRCVYSNDIAYQGNNNVDGNNLAPDKVDKSKKFSRFKS